MPICCVYAFVYIIGLIFPFVGIIFWGFLILQILTICHIYYKYTIPLVICLLIPSQCMCGFKKKKPCYRFIGDNPVKPIDLLFCDFSHDFYTILVWAHLRSCPLKQKFYSSHFGWELTGPPSGSETPTTPATATQTRVPCTCFSKG